jgi:hypothetical protein
MFCKHCGKNPNFEYTLAEWVTYLRGKYKTDWQAKNNECSLWDSELPSELPIGEVNKHGYL